MATPHPNLMGSDGEMPPSGVRGTVQRKPEQEAGTPGAAEAQESALQAGRSCQPLLLAWSSGPGFSKTAETTGAETVTPDILQALGLCQAHPRCLRTVHSVHSTHPWEMGILEMKKVRPW